MKNKMLAGVVATMMLTGSLVGCGKPSHTRVEDVDTGVDTGVVESRTKRSITVREDDGEKEVYKVRKRAYRNCVKGKRWPDCKG